MILRCLLAAVPLATPALGAQGAPNVVWSFQDSAQRGELSAVAFSPDGNYLAYGYRFGSEVDVREVATGTPVITASGSATLGISALEWAPSGHLLGVPWSIAGFGGLIFGAGEIYVPGRPTPFLTTDGHSGFVTDLAWAPDGSRFATTATDGLALVFDLAAGVEVLRVDHGSPAYAVAFDPAGAAFATAGEAGDVRVWDASTGAPLSAFTAHTSRIDELAWSPVFPHIATGSGDPADSRVIVSHALTGVPVAVHTSATQGVTGLDFVDGGLFLVAADRSQRIRLLSALAPVQFRWVDIGPGRSVTSLDVAPRNRAYAFGDDAGWVTLARP